MKPYACRLISDEDQELFQKIRRVVQEMPEVDLGKDERNHEILVSCHMLARALAKFFPVQVCDGYFVQRGYFHSWLSTGTVIIDAYPIAVIGGPILVDKKVCNPLGRQYVQEDIMESVLSDGKEGFYKNVEKVAEAVAQTIKKLEESNS